MSFAQIGRSSQDNQSTTVCGGIMFRKFVMISALFSLMILLGLSVVSASSPRPYIQINNGRTISITPSEQPQIVVQFGNRGGSLSDVRVQCIWDTAIRFNGQAQIGPFAGFEFLPPVAGVRPPQINYPATTVIDPALLVDLPRGQNYNVGFGIRLAANAIQGNFGGNLQCFVLDANFNVLATSAVTRVVVR
jgi:hypothetical protein